MQTDLQIIPIADSAAQVNEQGSNGRSVIAPGERRTFYSLQAGRGLAALMVVFFHIGNFVGKEPTLWHRTIYYRIFYGGLYGVDFFFILSGIVMVSAHWFDIDHPERTGRYLWKRFRRIYPIYWVFLIPTVLKQLRVTGTHGVGERNPFVILSSFLLFHIHSLGVNLVVSWTLFHEVLFYLVFAALLLNRRLGLLLCATWLCASFFFFTPGAFAVEPESYAQMLFSPLHFLFAFGMLAGWILQQRRGPAQLWVFVLGLTAYIGLLLLQLRFPRQAPVLRIAAGAGLTLALISLAEREAQTGFRVPRALTFLGDASYSIYLSHFMVVWALAITCFRLDQRLHLPVALWTLLILVVTVAVGVLTHLFIERPLLRLLGDRRAPKMRVGDSKQVEPSVQAARAC